MATNVGDGTGTSSTGTEYAMVNPRGKIAGKAVNLLYRTVTHHGCAKNVGNISKVKKIRY